MVAFLCFRQLCAPDLRGAALSAMMPGMAEAERAKRFTESVPGYMAGWLLAALWLYALSGVDAHAFSAFPACVVLGCAAALLLLALLMGLRLVRMSVLAWFSLAAGAYFLCRCLTSYALVESWGESALIVGALVYYVAGVYVAQNQHYRGVLLTLLLALLLSMLAWWAVQQPWFRLEWTGRATHTPEGKNNLPVALLVYKNFAGFFFFSGGVALGAWALWVQRGAKQALLMMVAAASVALSFFCETRAPFFLAPLALVGLWVFDVLFRLYSEQKVGVVSYVIGAILLVLVFVGVADAVLGRFLAGFFDNVDSHLRYQIWSFVCEQLPSAPLWGLGAGATEWDIIPVCNVWALPNYAHNEYVQVWADYGVIGLLFMLSIIAGHVVQGMRCVASEKVSPHRRGMALVAMLVLVFAAAYATADFPWHSFALVSLTAFVCGLLASPFPHIREARKWVSSSQAPVVKVLGEKKICRVLLMFVAAGVGAWGIWMGGKFYPVWEAQWEYNRLSEEGADAHGHQRRELIARLLPEYPDSALMDTYYLLPPYKSDWVERERLLKLAIQANPKQLFTVVMLVDALGKQQKFAEAEQLMRQYYVGDSMPASRLTNWPAYYAFNLLMWGREDYKHQRYGLALSKMEYAYAIHCWKRMDFNLFHRGGYTPWKASGGIKPWLKEFHKVGWRDMHMLRLIGVQPDHSWRQPMVPGGRPSLYSAIVDKKAS